MWFDTHTHLCDTCFDDSREEIIASFPSDNIAYVIDVGTNFSDSKKAIENACRYDSVYAAVGIHPDFIGKLQMGYQDELLSLCTSSHKIVALGEIGLDYHYDVDPREFQKTKMIEMIEVAKNAKLPIIVHDRDAHGDILDIIKHHCKNDVIGVLHCFSGSFEMAKTAIDMGFYISIGGPITFKNEKKLKEMVPKLPVDSLLIETDCPCLAPVPNRGKMNVPANINYTGKVLASCLGIDDITLSDITCKNAKELFFKRG